MAEAGPGAMRSRAHRDDAWATETYKHETHEQSWRESERGAKNAGRRKPKRMRAEVERKDGQSELSSGVSGDRDDDAPSVRGHGVS